MLNRGTVPGVDVVEVPATSSETLFSTLLLQRRDQVLRLSDVRLVTQQSLSRIEQRAVLTEQLDVGSHTQVRTTEPDDVTAVVTNALHLSIRQNQRIDQ